MTLAAVQDAWDDRQSGERIRSCSMIITELNKFVAEVLDRMPVVFEASDFEQWEHGDVKDAAALKPAGEGVLEKWPVTKRVNSSRADSSDSTLIERIELGPRADARALSALMDDPENLEEIGDLFGHLKSG